jgi:hypothetical protein
LPKQFGHDFSDVVSQFDRSAKMPAAFCLEHFASDAATFPLAK